MKKNHLSTHVKLSGRAVVAVGLISASAQGAVLVGYDFGPVGGGTVAATTVSPGVSGSDVTKGAGVGSFNQPDNLGYVGQGSVLQANPVNNTTNTPAAAISNDAYFTFTVTPDASQTIDLTSLTFLGARGGGGTPRGYDVRSSVDSFANTVGSADFLTNRVFAPVSIDLSGAQFSNLTTATEFRVYIYSPVAGNSVEFDDIELNGSITAVPEPSSWLLVAFGGLLLGRRKRS